MSIKFTVNRSRWLRGEGTVESRLLKEDGRMCCLGFLAKACGFSDEEILEVGHPCFTRGHSKWPDGILIPTASESKGTSVCNEIIRKNDCIYGATSREYTLKMLFSSIGIEVEFVDSIEQ